jgi:putative transposase
MARIARVVVPGIPHHVTQRGNRRQTTFFRDDDYREYIDFMAEFLTKFGVEVWAYCLMPNHVHLLAVPSDEEGLRRGIGEAHRRYTRRINLRKGWVGHLWQGRFASFPMDQAHLPAAIRHIERNPVRAGIVPRAGDYLWSSATAHLARRDDPLVKASPALDVIADWEAFLGEPEKPEQIDDFRRHERTGRPMGGRAFIAEVEAFLGRDLTPHKAGRPPKASIVDSN